MVKTIKLGIILAAVFLASTIVSQASACYDECLVYGYITESWVSGGAVGLEDGIYACVGWVSIYYGYKGVPRWLKVDIIVPPTGAGATWYFKITYYYKSTDPPPDEPWEIVHRLEIHAENPYCHWKIFVDQYETNIGGGVIETVGSASVSGILLLSGPPM